MLFASFPCALAQNRNFTFQCLDCPLSFGAAKPVAQKFPQRLDPIPIHSPDGVRQLVPVAASLHNQGYRNQRDQAVDANSQPEIIIFTDGEIFVESAKLGKQLLRHHDRRRTH